VKENSISAVAVPEKKANPSVVAVFFSLFLAAVDSTIVSPVLPLISHDLGHVSLYPWVMSAFLLPVALIAPFAGASADSFGVSTMLKIFLAVFVTASFAAALSPTMPALVAARALQGVGAGGIIVLSYSLLGALYGAEQRGKMQGMLSSVWGVSAIIGPVFGSVLAAEFGWRAIFWVNIPIGIAALVMLFLASPVGQRTSKVSMDMVSQMLLIVSACCLLLLINKPNGFWVSYSSLAISGLVTFALLVVRVRKKPDGSPLPLAFFRRYSLVSVVILVLLSSAGLYATVTLLPLALNQDTRMALSSGALIMLAALGWVFGAAWCGKVVARKGYFALAFVGMLLMAGGCLLTAMALNGPYAWVIALSVILLGLGMGFVATTTLVFAQNQAPREHIGTWTSTVQFLRNLGAALGINTLASIQQAANVENGFHWSFMVMGFCLLGAVMVTFLLPRNYRATT